MGKPGATAPHMILILDGHEVGTVAYLSGGQPLGSYTEESGGLNLTAIRRVSATEVRSLAALHHWARPGELLAGVPDHPVFKVFWDVASADSFAPPATTLSLRGSKQRWR